MYHNPEPSHATTYFAAAATLLPPLQHRLTRVIVIRLDTIEVII